MIVVDVFGTRKTPDFTVTTDTQVSSILGPPCLGNGDKDQGPGTGTASVASVGSRGASLSSVLHRTGGKVENVVPRVSKGPERLPLGYSSSKV